MMAVRTVLAFFCVWVGLAGCTPTQQLDRVFFPYDPVETPNQAWPRLVDVQPVPAQPEDTPDAIAQQRQAVVSAGARLQQNAQDAQQPIIDAATRRRMQAGLAKAKRL